MNILDDYEILSILGEGTFGVVRLGKNKDTGERVAIKILEKKKIVNKDDAERVDREIAILKRIKHINIVKVMNIVSDSEKIYIIMEFCQNGELFCHIVEKQQLEEEEAAYFYYQLINGLECLHHNGIVHRDLKPENLLISKDDLLKIIDFGLSNYFSSKTPFLSTPCGSPCYASPEMVSGKKYDGFSIDIWSTGIILYAMLCGYLPYEDTDNEVLFQKITSCDTEFPEDISNDGIDLMKKIMVPDPKQRITLEEIKKHKFYLKGKNAFKSSHPDLVKEVEKNYDLIKEKEKDNENDKNNNKLEKEIKRAENEKPESASVKEDIIPIFEEEKNLENNLTKDKKIKQNENKDKEAKVQDKKVIEEKEKEKDLRRELNEDENNFKSKSSDNVDNKTKENKDNKIKEIKIDFNSYNKNRENERKTENNNNKVNNKKVINNNNLSKNNDDKKVNIDEKNNNNSNENNEKAKLNININNNNNVNDKSKGSHHNLNKNEEKELIKSPVKRFSDKININKNMNINNNYFTNMNARDTINTKDNSNANPKEHINNNTNKKVTVQINTQINYRRRENKNNNTIIQSEKEKEKERKAKINVYKVSKNNNNYKMNNTIEYKESTFNKSEDLRKRNTLNGNDRNDGIPGKNNINNLKSYKTSFNRLGPKNKIIIVEESNKNNFKTSEYSTVKKDRNSAIKEVKVNKHFVNNHDKNNKIDAESINERINDAINAKTIPNLKNKIHINKTIVVENRNSLKQNKIPNKIEIIVNKRNKMVKNKTPGLTESQTINANYINSDNNYRLSENENKSNKLHSIIHLNNFIGKKNSLANTFSEPQGNKRKKNIVYSNHTNKNNNTSLNPKHKETFTIFSYNNENINNENKVKSSKRENPFSFSKFNLNKDLLMNKIPNIKESKTLNNTFKVEVSALENNSNSHRNKNLYSTNQNSPKLSPKISENNISKCPEKHRSICTNSQKNYPKQEYNNQTFNKNTIYKNNINNTSKSNSKNFKTLNENEGKTNIDFRKKTYKDSNTFHPFESNTYQNKDYHILHKNNYLTNYIVAEKNNTEEKKVNINKDRETSANPSSYLKESTHHKKNVSENIQKSITTIKREIYEHNLFNNTDSKSPKNELRTEKLIRFRQRKNHNYFISTYKKGICEKKLMNYMNYISNDSLNLPIKDIQQLSLLRKNETFQCSKNNTNQNSHRKNEHLSRKLNEFSNTIDKDNATKYDKNTLILNNNNSPIKLYTNNHQINNCRNNYIIPRRINSTYTNNFSYNDNNNDNQKKKISSNYITDNKNKINNGYVNNKLTRKGVIFNSEKDTLRNYNNNNYSKDNLERKNNFEIHNNANNNLNNANQNHNYSHNSNIITVNENHRNMGINRAKTTMDNLYKKRLDLDEIKSEEHRDKIGNINDNNRNKKIITSVSTKRSDNTIIQNNNENNNRRFKYIKYINTNTINNLEENINKNIINSCTDKNIINSNRNSNPTNLNNNDKNNQNVQMMNTTNKRKHKYQKDDLEELIIKLTKAKNEYKKYKEQQNNTLNNKANLENRKSIKPTAFLPQEINIEMSEHYIPNNNNRNSIQFKTRNFQVYAIEDSIHKMHRKRKNITTNNEDKGNMNDEQNFNYVFKQNNFYNNRNRRENLFNYRYEQK